MGNVMRVAAAMVLVIACLTFNGDPDTAYFQLAVAATFALLGIRR